MSQSTTSIQDSGPLSAGSIPSYANEHDPSWEEVIALVVIPGQPGAIRDAAGAWEVLFTRIEQVRSTLDQLSSGLQSWQGAAGEAYRGHLAELSGRLTQLLDGHRPVVQQLHTAADNLNTALHNMPIPHELVDEAMRARDKFHATGVLDTKFHAGYFWDALMPSYLAFVGDMLGLLTFGLADKASDMLRDFLSSNDDQAKTAYRTLAGQHVAAVNSLPEFPHLLADNIAPQVLTPPMPVAMVAPAAGPDTGTMPDTGAPTFDPGQYPGTSLAGAGGVGGLTAVGGAGGGPGGLGPIGGVGGLGAGGLSVGSTGAGAAAAGGIGGVAGASAVRPGGITSAGSAIAGRAGGGMPMMGGAAGGAGAAGAKGGGSRTALRGVGSTVAGGSAMGRGGAPMGGAGGDGGDATDHNTWLQEDEDVWGTDSDAAPPVLG